MKTFGLGSTSPLKFRALAAALDRADRPTIGIEIAAVDSGIDAQPIGLELAAFGADNRARRAATKLGIATGIGIESCITLVRGEWIDTATVVIVDHHGIMGVSTSLGVSFPHVCVAECFEAGVVTHTVGEFIARRYGGDPADPHSTLTGGKLKREALIADAIYSALLRGL